MNCDLAIKVDDVPTFLIDSPFFNGIDQSDSTEFVVPRNCFSSSDEVDSMETLTNLLHTLRFWGSSHISSSMMEYFLSNAVDEKERNDLVETFPELSYLKQLSAIATAKSSKEKVKQAILSGNTAIVKLLGQSVHNCTDALEIAAESGSPAMLRYVHSFGQPPSMKGNHGFGLFGDVSETWGGRVWYIAAEKGDLPMLQCAHELGITASSGVAYLAFRHGHIHCWSFCMQYSRFGGEHFYRDAMDRDTSILIAMHDKMNEHEDFKNQAFFTADTATHAAWTGNVSALVYLHSQGCEWTAETCKQAALAGHLTCLQFAIEHGCPWDARTIENAAIANHLDCLVYALQKYHEGVNASTHEGMTTENAQQAHPLRVYAGPSKWDAATFLAKKREKLAAECVAILEQEAQR